MTIQISIVIWTVICFVLLMLILHNFLFKPVLKMIDSRKERLALARQKEALQNKKIEENKAFILQQKDEHAKRKEQLAKEAAEQLNVKGKLQVEEAQRKRIKDVDDYRALMENSYKQIISVASKEMDKIAETLVTNIISDRS